MNQYNASRLRSNYIEILFGILLAFLITSQEFQFFNMVFGGSIKQIIVGAFVVLFLLNGVYNVITSKSVAKRYWSFKIVVLVFSIYLVIHDFMFSDGLRSIKYSLYLILSIFTWDYIKLTKISRVFVYVVSFFCLLVILQFLILTFFYAGHITSFSLVPGLENTLGREDLSLTNPFGFGFITSSEWDTPFTFGNLEMRRANSFTTEPKFTALLFLTSLGTLGVLKETFSRKKFHLLLMINFFGLCLTMAGSMFFGLIIALLLYRMNRKKFNFSMTIFFFFITLVLFPSILLFVLVYLPEYWTARALNGVGSLILINDMFVSGHSLLGTGYGDELSGFAFLPFVILMRYGWIGVCGMILIFVFLVHAFATSEKIKEFSHIDYHLLAVIILMVNYFLYFIIFLPEMASPLSTFIIIVILNSDKMSMERKLMIQKT